MDSTFHGVVIIATATAHTHQKIVPRVTDPKEDIAAVGRIQITHPKSWNDLASLKFERVKDPTVTAGKISPVVLLWKVSFTVRSPHPSWSGMMQAVN